jgi:hypothetical protein
MRCATCGSELQRDARFCASCGTPVTTATVATCVGCGADLAPATRFCASCGTPLDAPSPTSDSGRERKVATLLFADLVGYTSLNDGHDPEIIEAVVGRAFDRLSAEVERYATRSSRSSACQPSVSATP